MAVEALWSVKFGFAGGPENDLSAGGILVLETSRVLGGDSWSYYVGDYEVVDGRIAGNIRVRMHNPEEGVTNPWGTDEQDFETAFEGIVLDADKLVTGTLSREGLIDAPFQLLRVGELP